MAINFEEKKDNKTDIKKIAIAVIVIVLIIIIYFMFFKKENNTIQNSSTAFSPISIDYSFLNSEKVANLEEFRGIPVLPGFYIASDKQIQPEEIETGRENPFKQVTKEEVEQAILKVITRLTEEEPLEELKQSIINSSLYNTDQKETFISIIEAKIEEIREINETGIEIINEEGIEVIENIEEEENPSSFKVW